MGAPGHRGHRMALRKGQRRNRKADSTADELPAEARRHERMTRIDFYSNAESRLHTACVLIAKAFAQHMRVAVFAPDPEVARTADRMLWTFQATSFVPHCAVNDRLAADTPVLIVQRTEDAGHDQLIVNLALDCPPAFSRFKRLVEVVGREGEDRERARERWRFYKERGYEVNHVDLSKA